MQNGIWQWIIALAVAYVIGSIPIGLFVVYAVRGVDIRKIGSGRIGGTNVMRAAGWQVALLSGLLDMLKATLAVSVARWLDGPPLLLALAGVMAIVGHNYSLFLGFKGGAGTGTCMGGALALWPWSGLITIPTLVLLIGITRRGSIASIVLAFVIPILFTIRAALGLDPWAFAVYGVLTSALTLWALRPNIQRLVHGEEKAVNLNGNKDKSTPSG